MSAVAQVEAKLQAMDQDYETLSQWDKGTRAGLLWVYELLTGHTFEGNNRCTAIH